MNRRVCIFGASTVKGNYDEEKGGWANRLKLFLEYQIKSKKYSVYPLGISGNTSSDILSRLEGELSARSPHVVIFSLGGNDASRRGKTQRLKISMEEYGRNLKEIIEVTKKYSTNIVFINMYNVDESRTTPVSWNNNAFYHNADIQNYNQILDDVCTENRISYVDMGCLFLPEELFDGLHPNTEGHEKIFQEIKKYLLEQKFI